MSCFPLPSFCHIYSLNLHKHVNVCVCACEDENGCMNVSVSFVGNVFLNVK